MTSTRRLAFFLAAVFSILSVGFVGPTAADEQDSASTDGTDYVTYEIEDEGSRKQLAQGVTGYEVPRRIIDIGRGDTVASRPRPEYDPLGVRAGSFLIFPSVAIEEQYESNIFFTPDDEEDDFITRIIPSLTAQSTWSNHSLSLRGGADAGFYADNSDENYVDYFVGATGRLDIRRSTSLTLSPEFRHDHESRSSPDDPGTGKEPTEFDVYRSEAQLFHNFGRINATVGGEFERFSYEDVPLAAGGGDLNNHERDRNEYLGSLRIGYEIQPTYEAFVLGTYSVIDYDGLEGGVNRDSDGYFIGAGMDLDLTGVLFGEVFIGFESRDYDSSALDDFSGVSGGGELTWNVTRLTTVTGAASVAVRETTVAGASGSLLAAGDLDVDHELLRNLLIGVDGSIARDDFEGIDRVDYVYGAGADVTYLINRYLSAGLDYSFQTRDSDAAGEDFDNHIVLGRVRLQY